MALIRSYRNTFDGGSNGVALTPGNTGGASGDALQIAGGSSLIFTEAQSHSGELSIVANSAEITQAMWQFTADNSPSLAFRYYVYHVSGTFNNVHFRVGGNAASVIALTSGRLRFGTAAVGYPWEAAQALPTNQWVRIECYMNQATRTFRGAYYIGDSLVPVEDSGVVNDVSLRAEEGTFGTVAFGQVNASSYVTYIDSVALDIHDSPITSFIGPWVAPHVILDTPVVTLGSVNEPSEPAATDGSVTVTWPSVDGAAGYSAHRAATLTPEQGDFVQVSANVTSPYTFTGLAQGNYAFGIRAEV